MNSINQIINQILERRRFGQLPVLLLAVTLVNPVSVDAQSTAPLLRQNDFIYVGAFRLPTNFQYGGTAVAYNPANNSLFMVGHSNQQQSAEITIPPLVNSSSLNNLNVASVLQPLTDALEGQRRSVNPGDPNDQRIGGQLVYNGKLYVSVYSYYDAQKTQLGSHFVRPLDLSVRGQLSGPVKVGNRYPGWVSGYMTPIPAAWQAAFGGPALTGNFGLAIAGQQSWGPAASVFDPEDIANSNPAPAELLVGYPKDQSVLGGDWGTTNGFFNGSTRADGILFAEGTSSVLFFGKHGTGPFCYGSGAKCNDPVDSTDGVHGYPYIYQVWSYDANDLVAVRQGAMQPQEVVPYEIWQLQMPLERDDSHRIGGVAYDKARNLLYFVQRFRDNSGPVVHAFRLNLGPRPAAPGSFGAQ